MGYVIHDARCHTLHNASTQHGPHVSRLGKGAAITVGRRPADGNVKAPLMAGWSEVLLLRENNNKDLKEALKAMMKRAPLNCRRSQSSALEAAVLKKSLLPRTLPYQLQISSHVASWLLARPCSSNLHRYAAILNIHLRPRRQHKRLRLLIPWTVRLPMYPHRSAARGQQRKKEPCKLVTCTGDALGSQPCF